MLFLTYWELNENMPAQERMQVAQKLLAKELFPPKGVEIVGWHETPDAWGILMMEAATAADAFAAIELWRAAGAGFFKMTKTAPAIPISEGIAIGETLMKALAG
jgi:hypothetical protein